MRENQRLSKLNKEVHEEAVKNVQGEVSSLYELLAVAKNENLTKQERNNAIKEINKNYPEHLENINLENINTQFNNSIIVSNSAIKWTLPQPHCLMFLAYTKLQISAWGIASYCYS